MTIMALCRPQQRFIPPFANLAETLSVWLAVPHVWPLFHHLIPEGRQSLLSAGEFLGSAAAGMAS